MDESTTSVESVRPMCFIAMPFGCRTADGVTIDFDRTWKYIRRGAEHAGVEAILADVELAGGFIHKPMLERLLVAEYVVADLTMANPNVMYGVGVRHGASARATLLLCAASFVSKMPFDFKPLRMVSYELGADGSLSGIDVSRFTTHSHLLSWARVCPRLDESAGKVHSTRTIKGAV